MNPQTQNIDLNQIAKQFCERVIVGSSDQFFVLIPIVGTNATAYALTPEHAKNLVKVLSEHITKFEANVREIKDINAAIPSPIQTGDLPPTK
jgi:hypothetical protein